MTEKTSRFLSVAQVEVEDLFFSRIQDTVISVMIPFQEKAMNDGIPGLKKSHVLENLRIAAGENSGEFYGKVFQDSDIAKWLEAVSYALILRPDPELEARADDVIGLLGRVQQEDGYLHSYFIAAEPDHKWQNLEECHELYCAGHMTEAGIAYFQATGKDSLLKIVMRLCDLICERFGPGKEERIPGHEEIELALLKLYHLTGEKRYLDTAKAFIDRRGTDPECFRKEEKERGWKRSDYYSKMPPSYMQNHKPLREQDSVEGHAVRCMYLLTAAADLAAVTGDDELMQACRRLWNNMTERRMYITGGIGSAAWNEGFTRDYDLPNDNAYAETCAAVGVCFFAKQLLEAEPDSAVADVMERCLYNGTISGMQLDGTKFFYINQLESDPERTGEAYGDEEYTPERIGWYDCACCPPNLARLMTSLGSYIWSEKEDTLYSHLFIGSSCHTAAGGGAQIRLESRCPWEPELKYTVTPDRAGSEFTLAVRHPGWSRTLSVTVNGAPAGEAFPEENGYLLIRRAWNPGDMVTVLPEMKPLRVYADPRVKADTGCTALMRGPLVYAFEGVDNGKNLWACRLPREAEIRTLPYDPGLLCGITALEADGMRQKTAESLYGEMPAEEEPVTLRAVPYYAWCNRGATSMRVWMRE